MTPAWINYVAGVPLARDFTTTQGFGSPIVINLSTSQGYYLTAGNVVTALAGGGGGVTPTGTGFTHITAGVQDAAAKLVDTADINDGQVTLAKQANVATATVFYRKTAAAGAPEVQTLATLKTDLALTGTNSGDQTITLTGNVTGTGTGSFATTIAAGVVTLAMQANMATASVVYRKTAGAGAPEVQTLATLKTDLGLTGTNSGDQTITLTGNVTGTGTGSFATTIAAGVVTLAMQANMATSSLVYRKTAGAGAPEIQTLATLKTDLGLSGLAISTLLGRGAAAGAGDAQSITLGTNLSMSGTTLNATSGGDPWTYLALNLADYNNATSTFTNITDGTTTMIWTPPADTNWELEASLLIWTTSATNLPKIGAAIAAGATRGYGAVNMWQAGATTTVSVHINGGWSNAAGIINAQFPVGGVLTALVAYLCEVKMGGRSGAAPTAISLQMACETAAAATCYVKRGSLMKYRTF